jgi:hypothetical protein
MVLYLTARKRVQVQSLEDASREVQRYIGRGINARPGSSIRFKDFGLVTDGDVPVARVSYNGRVWSPEPWRPGMVPLQEAAGDADAAKGSR